MNEQAIEAEIQAKGLNAPRLTPEHIDRLIVSELFSHVGSDGWYCSTPLSAEQLADTYRALNCLTICVLVLRNGYTIVGKSACASPENFNAELGRKIAREDARRQIWALEGYALRNKLASV